MTISPPKSEETLLSLSPLSLENLLPLPNERTVLVGRTGSGKTTLAERFLRYYQYVVTLDIKNRIAWEGYERHQRLESLIRSEHHHLIYAPTFEETEPALIGTRRIPWGTYIEAFFEWAYTRGNTLVYVDEVMGITSGDEMPRYYRAINTRGRELGIGLLSATQRPTRIPQVILSEAETFFVFSVQLPQDIVKVEEITGERLPTLRGHEFAYARVGSEYPPQKYVLMIV